MIVVGNDQSPGTAVLEGTIDLPRFYIVQSGRPCHQFSLLLDGSCFVEIAKDHQIVGRRARAYARNNIAVVQG